MLKVGAKYVHTKTGETIVITKVDEKCKTCIVDLANGKNRKYTFSTISKNYKCVEPDEELAGDGTPLNEVGKQIAEQAKAKAEQAKAEKQSKPKKERKPKVDNSAEVDKILQFVYKTLEKYSDCSVGVPRSEEMKFRALRCGKKQFCKLMWSGKNVKLYFREEAVKTVSNDIQLANYNLPFRYTIENADKQSLDNISKMFELAIAGEKSEKTK